jgi:hypothetical protein
MSAIPGSTNTLDAAKKGAIGGPNTIPANNKSAKKLTQLTCKLLDKTTLCIFLPLRETFLIYYIHVSELLKSALFKSFNSAGERDLIQAT